MRRALLALCAICGALAWSAVATAGNVVIRDYDVGMEIQTDRFDPCTGANDLTILFAGATRTHVTAKLQGDAVISARVDIDQAGGLATNIGGIDYYGFLTYSSKVNLNQQNQVASVQFAVAAVSLDLTSSLIFDVTERVTLNASLDPVSAATRISVAGCPA